MPTQDRWPMRRTRLGKKIAAVPMGNRSGISINLAIIIFGFSRALRLQAAPEYANPLQGGLSPVSCDRGHRDALPSIFPVIMCGGSGTRLWPVSTPSRPKQFVPLIGGASLFRQTVNRVCGLDGFERLIVVTGAHQAGWVADQLGDDLQRADILLEPEGRDSAPAIAAAACHIRDIDPGGVLVIVASDHHIPDRGHFHVEMAAALKGALAGEIVTLGIRPTEASSAYGYIKPADSGERLCPIVEFVEKPNAETAQNYVSQGYLWNSGNFIADARTLIKAFSSHAPELLSAVDRSLNKAKAMSTGLRLSDDFRSAPKISFDYAVMEKTRNAAVLRSSLEWSDLGAWDAVHKVSPKDGDGCAVDGDALVMNSKDSLIRVSAGKFAAVSGVSDLAVIVEGDTVLVSPLDRSQDVKTIVDQLNSQDRLQTVETALDGRAGVTPDDAAALKSWLFSSALPLWWSIGFDRENNTWRESLNRDATPTTQDRRARVQGRQSYVYALAGKMGWAGPWREAVRTGVEGALDVFGNADGLLHALADDAGKIIDDACLLYDQTFLLLALAEGRTAIEDAPRRALHLLDAIDARFARTGLPGYREAGAHAFQSNAHMHLFEAALAWIGAGSADGFETPRWNDLAVEIADLAMTHFIDANGGFLREYFDADWKTAKGDGGVVVDPGHQFEWAWLLARWSKTGGDSVHLQAARRLYEAGLHGVDRQTQAVIQQIDDTLQPVTGQARLWSQTEWLKASLTLGGLVPPVERPIYHREAASALVCLNRFLATDIPGLWHDKLTYNGGFAAEPSPASSLYHIASATDVLLKHAGDGQ